MATNQSTILAPPLITRREWWVVAMISLAAITWSLVPTYFGLQQTPPGHRYLYTNIPDVTDFQVYFYSIDQNAQGRVLYRNYFTGEPQRAVFFHPLWLVLGGIQRLTGWSAPVIFTGSRAIGAIVLLFLIYWFISHFLDQARWRLVGWLTAVFGGGLGGVALSIMDGNHHLIQLFTRSDGVDRLPADITTAAGFPWMIIGHSPHLVVALALVITTLILFWRQRPIWQPGLCVLGLGFVHPYDIALVFGVLLVHMTIVLLNGGSRAEVKKNILRLGQICLWTLPVIVYYGSALFMEPTLRKFYHQNFLLPANPLLLAAGYGAIGPLAVYALFRAQRAAEPRWIMVVAWAIGGLTLYYAPFLRFQAKMLNGYAIPLAILATTGFRTIWPKLRLVAWGQPAAATLIATLTFSTVIFFPRHVIASQKNEPQYHYASDELLQALAWVRTNTPAQAVVLGDFQTGNLVPYFANRPTYLGHNIQTIAYRRRLDIVRTWFFGTSGEEARKREFLRTSRIDYVIWGPDERRRGPFDPAKISTLRAVYMNTTVTVFQMY